MSRIELSDKEYSVLLDLYNELNDVFKNISQEYKDAFFNRLFNRAQQKKTQKL